MWTSVRRNAAGQREVNDPEVVIRPLYTVSCLFRIVCVGRRIAYSEEGSPAIFVDSLLCTCLAKCLEDWLDPI